MAFRQAQYESDRSYAAPYQFLEPVLAGSVATAAQLAKTLVSSDASLEGAYGREDYWRTEWQNPPVIFKTGEVATAPEWCSVRLKADWVEGSQSHYNMEKTGCIYGVTYGCVYEHQNMMWVSGKCG